MLVVGAVDSGVESTGSSVVGGVVDAGVVVELDSAVVVDEVPPDEPDDGDRYVPLTWVAPAV